MKLKYDFAVREIAGDYVLVPLGKAALAFSGMLTTTDVGAFICENLKEDISEQELAARLTDSYNVDEKTAAADLRTFIDQLKQLGLIEE